MRHRLRIRLLAAAAIVAMTSWPSLAAKKDPLGHDEGAGIEYVEPEAVEWKELEIPPPTFPRPENLREFYVSPTATSTYLIDASTLSPGSDGVVRYVLVVRTAGGAQNISFEGIHCEEGNWKLYATGGSDGQWSKARISEWRPIENKPVNRYHAALSRELFCPNGIPIATADEGRNALRLGKHPNAN
jgi:hypothetical protein